MTESASAERRVEPLVRDLREEMAALGALVGGRSDAELARVTPFQGWRARDVITHLAFVDRLARIAVTDAGAYAAELGAMSQGTAPPPGDDGSARGVFDRLNAYARQ